MVGNLIRSADRFMKSGPGSCLPCPKSSSRTGLRAGVSSEVDRFAISVFTCNSHARNLPVIQSSHNTSGVCPSYGDSPIERKLPMSKEAAQHHVKAAEHHEHAARHHKEAAKHHEAGAHETAGHHAHLAHGHHLLATEHAEEAAKHQTEQHDKH